MTLKREDAAWKLRRVAVGKLALFDDGLSNVVEA
jgi:hypothetical protein